MLLAFLAISTLASAHAGNDDPNVVHACIGNVTKVVRVVGVSGSCITSSPRDNGACGRAGLQILRAGRAPLLTNDAGTAC